MVYESCMQVMEDLFSGIMEINEMLFFNKTILPNKAAESISNTLVNQTELDVMLKECRKWREFVGEIINNRYHQKNKCDEKFASIIDYARYVDKNMIIQNIVKNLESKNEEEQYCIQGYYHKFSRLWGILDLDEKKYDVIIDRINNLTDHVDDFQWLYDNLGDYRSKVVLVGILNYWIDYNPGEIIKFKEANFDDYYDYDLLDFSEEEVVVDLGAYTGDSAMSFIENYGKYKSIYCYEITPSTVEILKKNLADYPNVHIKNKGAGSKNCNMYFNDFEDFSCNNLKEDGGIPIEVVAIDDDITEKITFIKMDIEGAEQDALLGCKRHIVEERPKLAICVYHNNEDIWKIPRMIREIRSDYKLYLRSNGIQWGPSEIVAFGL